MKRLAVILLAVACGAVVAVLGTGASKDDSKVYRVRAIFDSAFSVIAGEDVKIAGVKVGKIESLSVTPDNKAAIVLAIDKPGFNDFRKDASCRIRPQSLIGEKFVECNPTQPRAPGEPAPPPLKVIQKGQPGEGQYLLPVTNTQRTVDIDLLNNIMRLPFRQRFAIILNEFGAGLAGNGRALNEVIRRADPALRETDKVLNILAEENRVLRDLAREGDRALAPLAERRRQVADFVDKAGSVAQATAEHRPALQRTFQRLPRFLEELRPTMVRLGAFADEAAPVTEDLGAEAPSLSRFARALKPFSEAGIPAIKSLGAASDVGKVAVPKTLPITKDTRALARDARPLAGNLRATLESLQDTGGIERFMDFLFFQISAINGFDSVGHYLRAQLVVNTCTAYATTPVGGCAAKFSSGATSSRARAATHTGDPALDRMIRILNRIAEGQKPAAAAKAVLGAKPAAAPRRHRHATRHKRVRHHAAARRTPLQLPSAVLPGTPQGAAPQPQPDAPQATGSQQQPAGPAGALLDYLLGGGS
ncbi:MAG TPA: MlaD family protein [Solirubrobacteraceae bacterium]|jgi:ABC-type transporter Mla subunit MlaD